MQNFAKEETQATAEKIAINRGYWGYQEMTEAETKKVTGAGWQMWRLRWVWRLWWRRLWWER
jgi:hypothetical protein